MATITIKFRSHFYPADDGKQYLIYAGVLVADPGDFISGIAAKLANGSREVFGKTTLFAYGGADLRRPRSRQTARWVIAFVLPPGFPTGSATITIQGLTYPGRPQPASITDPISVPSMSRVNTVNITVTDPDTSDRSTAEADFFVASGPVTQNHTAVSATMSGTDAEYLGTEDGVWCAVFPPLPPRDAGNAVINYILFVADNGSHSDTKPYTFS